jgi:hypothetical protein
MSASASIRSILFVIAAGLLWAGCTRQPPPLFSPPPPVPSLTLRQAETALRSGDYVRADLLYAELAAGGAESEGLENEREMALARRALIHALPGTPVHDRARARALLDQLEAEYPDTFMRTEVDAVLGILPVVDDLGVAVEQGLGEIEVLEAAIEAARREREMLGLFLAHSFPYDGQFDLDRAREAYRRLVAASPDSRSRRASERILFLLSEWERLNSIGAEQDSTVAELGRQISALRQELDRLKEIDLGRRLPD